MKKIRYIFEACLVYLFLGCFRMLGVRYASAVGGWIARHTGPHLSVHHRAMHNIRRAFPEKSPEEYKAIITQMWDNLGRTIGEMAHLRSFTGSQFHRYVSIENQDIITKAAAEGKGYIIVSGHFSNWELGPRALAEIGHPSLCVYRKANNPYVEKIIQAQRSTSHKAMVEKGTNAAKACLKELTNHGSIGLLVDQKMNNGISVPFFGHEAMTAPAAAELAKRFNCPIIPVQMIRTRNNYFRLRFLPAINANEQTTEDIMLQINHLFEDWIRQHPAQWFWVHARWPKKETH